MKKSHVQNCISKEKRIFESNIKKYKRLIEIECLNSEESAKSNKFESVEIISEDFISEPKASTSVDATGINYVECCEILTTGSVGKVKGEPVRDINEPVADSSNKKDIHDILAVLTQINTRFEKLEENVTQIQQNQSVLSNGQAVIVNNQQQIIDLMEKIGANVKNLEASTVTKPEMMAQSQRLMEMKIFIKRVDESVRRMTGESYDKSMDKVTSMLPLKTLVAVQELQQKLDSAEFSQAMVTYLHKVKGTSEDVSSVIRSIFTDDLLELYNWEGRCEKPALGKLLLFNKTLRDVFQQQGSLEFEKSVKKAIERSHHRVKQKKYLQKENKK